MSGLGIARHPTWKGEDVQGLTRSGRGKPEWNFSWDLCYLVLFAYALAHAYHIHIKFERNGFGSPYFWNNICFYDLSKVHYKHSQFISKASLSGRVRDGGAKQLLAKQLQGLNSSTPEFMNLTTGQIRCKKPKKEKSPVERSYDSWTFESWLGTTSLGSGSMDVVLMFSWA